MAIVAFSELSPEVLAAAPACPTPTVVRALRSAARELCEKASCYQYDMGVVVVPAGIATVALDVPNQTVLHKPIALTLDGHKLWPTSPTLLDQDYRDWRTSTGIPSHFMRSTEDQSDLMLYPIPQGTYTTTTGLRGRIAVKPTRNATGVEEIFFERYQDAVIDGALGRLLTIRSAPWYQPDLAAYHESEFIRAIEVARTYGSDDDLAKWRTMRYGGI